MQKGVFLLTHDPHVHRWSDAYPYEPYNWGPYSSELNEDLSSWQRDGLIVLSFAGDARYGRYVLTTHGSRIAASLWRTLDSSARSLLVDVRTWITNNDFNSLLGEVYRNYPEFATRSHWSRKA